MAFQDTPNGGRIVLYGSAPVPVTLVADVLVGDLLSPLPAPEGAGEAAAGWGPAAGGPALLVAGATAPAGATVQAYRAAVIDFGEACAGAIGDPLQAGADPPGSYAQGGAGAVIGRMITPSVGDITPNDAAAAAAPPTGAAAPGAAWSVSATLVDDRTMLDGQNATTTTARLARLIADLQDAGVLGRI